MAKRLVLMICFVLSYCVPRGLPQAKGEAAAEKSKTVAEGTASISEKTAPMQKMAGYFNIYWDAKQGKLWLEIDKWGTEFLYQSSLPAGIGSNDIGLDRGQLGGAHVVRVERSGPKGPLVQSNLEYRAVSDDSDERRAGGESVLEVARCGGSWGGGGSGRGA